RTLQVKTGQVVEGNYTAQSFDLSSYSGDGLVIHGRGGTDVLNLNALASTIVSIDGAPLSAFSPTAGGQAIYQGLAVDYVRLTSGREIYFTGIERREVLQPQNVEQTIDLMVTANDDRCADQWNLHTTDVPG